MPTEEKNELPPNISDHDLLIVLHTTMRHMSRDIATIKDDNTQRLAVVEATKFDKEDALRAMADADKVHQDLSARIERRQLTAEAEKTQAANDRIHQDHETRMRRTERTIYIATGALAILQIIIGLAQ